MAVKDQKVRLLEVMSLYQQLKDFGLEESVCEGIREFKGLANKFVKEGYSMSGKIYLREIKRDLIYVLSMQPHITCNITLRNKDT